jgi:lysophospholipase L1-like esterase
MAPSTRTSIGRRLAFSLVMLAIVFGTAELLARLLGGEVLEQAASPPPRTDDDTPNLLGNPFLLYEMAPGERFESGIHIQINSMGLRGPEWSPDKPSSVRRVMALGDSSVYGFGVEDDEVFTARLDRALGDGVQVINSAVPGYSTYQTINLLQIRSLSLQPDLLLVGCIWSDNNFDSFVDRDLLAAYSSFRNRHARAAQQFLGRSSLYTILDYKLRVLRTFPEERRVGWMIGRGEKIGERRVPIGEYARNLESIVELAHDADAEVAFMVLPNREDLVAKHESGAAWDPYREVMRDTATRHGAPVMELPDLFRTSGLEADALFLDEMHPTAQGHALWAELAQQTLEERGWPQGRPLERDPVPGPIPDYEDPFVQGERAPPPGEQPPEDPGQADRRGAASGRISGTITVPEVYQGSPIQLDAMAKGSAQPGLLGTLRVEGSGPFELLLSDLADVVVFVAYVDKDGDGPGPGDPRIDLYGGGLALPESGVIEGVELDLGKGAVTQTFDHSGAGAASSATPSPGDAQESPPQAPPNGGPIVTDQPGSAKVP